jgi:alkylhydroperoxidase/carboxymuconolactone decarboxylase family protein YurZ
MTPLPPFLQKLSEIDPGFVEQAAAMREQALYTASALDVKTKLLIALALDVAHGEEEGVRLLSSRAREAGASDAEILDVLRVCYSVAGLQCLSTGVKAFG